MSLNSKHQKQIPPRQAAEDRDLRVGMTEWLVPRKMAT
jgi:hypothetical protein